MRFRGIDDARPTPEVLAALAQADVVVIAPSNPIVSIGPILALAGMTEALAAARRGRGVPVVAVSGIIGGKALKGPADRMLTSLGQDPARSASPDCMPASRPCSSWTRSTGSTPAIAELGLRPVVADTR